MTLDLGLLKITIGVDNKEANKAFNETGDHVSKFAEGAKKVLGGMAKATTTALAAATAGVIALTKKSLESYAEYEQLVGGVDTLFKNSSIIVQKYADNAYKTAGLSANEYMETVTGFSASLLQGLKNNTVAASIYADMAITDMSDNANKMGSSMASIQNAYQGFAKQNYTMLDNLKLGYGGTADEMARLIKDSGVLGKEAKDLTAKNLNEKVSFDQIIKAIHIMQERMGIAGTTAKEASTTIQGSINSTKAAWQNLLVGIADDNANIDKLIDNLVNSIETAATNIIPRIEIILQGIGKLIEKLAPIIAEKLPEVISKVLPNILKAASSLVSSFTKGLKKALPTLAAMIPEVVLTIVDTIVANLPMLLEMGIQCILALIQGIAAALPDLIPTIVQAVLTMVQTILDNIPLIIDAAIQLILGFVDGILKAIPFIIEALPQIIDSLINGILGSIPQIIDAGIQLLTSLVENLPAIIQGIVKAIPKIITSVIDAICNNIPLIVQAGVDLFMALIENLPTIIIEIVKAIPQIIKGIVEALGKGIAKMAECGLNLIKGLWQGIKDAASWLWNKVKGWCDDLIGKIKNFFGIHSPSTLFADFGKYMVEGLGNGIEDNVDYALDAIDDMNGAIEESFNPSLNASANLSGGGYGNNSLSAISRTNTQVAPVKQSNSTITQNNYFTSKELTPYEQQVQLKRMNKNLAEVFA